MKHGYGNDGLAMPASVAHRGMDLFDFDRRHEWKEEHGDGHQHRQSPANAPDPQDGLIAVIGGSATAAGDASAVTGFVENFAANEGAHSIAIGEAIFQASAHSSNPGGGGAAASTFLDVSSADFIIEEEVGQSKHGSHDASAFSELDYRSRINSRSCMEWQWWRSRRVSIRRARSVRWQVGRLASCPEAPTPSSLE
jgi:hypothetical protein